MYSYSNVAIWAGNQDSDGTRGTLNVAVGAGTQDLDDICCHKRKKVFSIQRRVGVVVVVVECRYAIVFNTCITCLFLFSPVY